MVYFYSVWVVIDYLAYHCPLAPLTHLDMKLLNLLNQFSMLEAQNISLVNIYCALLYLLRMCEEQTTKVNPLNSCSYLADFLRLQPWIYWQQWVWLNVVFESFSQEAEMQFKLFKVHVQPNNLYYIGLRCKYSEKYVLLCSWFYGSNSFTFWLNNENERIVPAMNYP